MILNHYIELLQWYRWHVLFLIVFSTLAFGLAGYYQRETSPEYTTAANVLLIPSEAELEFGLAGTTRRAGIQTLSETYMEYVKSRPVIEAALAKIDAAAEHPSDDRTPLSPSAGAISRLTEQAKSLLSSIRRRLTELNTGTYIEIPEEERRIRGIQNAITVSNVASTHILRIEVTLDDPEYAALIANTLAEAYVERVTAESNSDANELEAYLQGQIAEKEEKIEQLRAEKARLDERYGLGNNFVGAIEDQQRVEETQLAELHSRLLTVNLSRASTSATQARLVEPAVAPAYVSSPGIISMAQIGLLIGLIVAAASVVIRDAISDTIKTSTDLHRLVGSRSIGLLRHSRFALLPRRTARKFGLMVQQHFVLSRDSSRSKSPVALKTPSHESTGSVVEGQYSEVPNDHRDFWTTLNNLAKLRKVANGEPSPSSTYGPRFARVTGLVSMETLCRATIHIAAGMASIGNKVYCKLPTDAIKRPPRLKYRHAGEVVYSPPDSENEDESNYITIECLGPMNTKFGINGSSEPDPGGSIICVLPQDQIPEKVVEAMTEKLAAKDSGDWHFLLMSSAKRL